MSNRIEISGLSVDAELYRLIDQDIAPGTGIDSAQFWLHPKSMSIPISVIEHGKLPMEEMPSITRRAGCFSSSSKSRNCLGLVVTPAPVSLCGAITILMSPLVSFAKTSRH